MKLGKREIVFFKMAVKNGRVVSKRCAPIRAGPLPSTTGSPFRKPLLQGRLLFREPSRLSYKNPPWLYLDRRRCSNREVTRKASAHANSGTTAVKTGLAGIRGGPGICAGRYTASPLQVV